MDVMFYEVFKEEELLLRAKLSKKIKAKFTHKTIQEFLSRTPPAPLICIRTQSIIPRQWAKQIRGVLTRSQGFDHLIKYRQETKGRIACGYLGHYCDNAVAEHAVMAMMMLFKKVKKQIKNFETFDRDGLMGSECLGRKTLVVGVGNIGSRLVSLTEALGMEARGVDIKRSVKKLRYVPLNQGVPWADCIFCALPLTDQTRGMLNYQILKRIKPGAIFVNISRGEISPIKDLDRLLKEERLGGLSLDVFENESDLAVRLRNSRRRKSRPVNLIKTLQKRDDVIFTPHNAFNTSEGLEAKANQTVRSIVCFLSRKKFPHPVPEA